MSEPDHLEATNWFEGVLADIANINPPVDLKGLDKDSIVTLITMADVDESGKIVNRHTRKLSEVKNGFTRFQESDVLFAKITPCMENGKGAIASKLQNGYGFGSTEFHVLRAKESGCPGFIFHISTDKKFRNKALTFFSGSAGQQRVDSEFFSKYRLEIPPINEQRQIARILTTVDNLIEKTEALIAKYEAIKQGMMHDLFTRGVDENGRLRPSYQEAPGLYDKTVFGWVPKDWQIKEMNFFLDYISYGFTNPMPEMNEGPWMVTAANIFQGGIQYNTCRHTSKEAFDRLLTKKSRPIPGDILLTKDGTLGRIALVEKNGICINQSVAILRINEKTAPMFIKLLLESPFYQQRLLHDAGGSTIKHIYITVVDKMPVAIPKSRIEQEKIISRIENIDKKAETERKYHNKMMSIKTALMQNLLTGKVRVTPDEETKAHV